MRWLGPDGMPGDAFPRIQAGALLSKAVSEKLFRHAPKSFSDVFAMPNNPSPRRFRCR